MKKLFLTLFFACGIFVLLSQSELLWSKFNLLDEPRIHKIQKGESLSRLAQQHYGDAQRWQELALVNRAPKPNHIEVGEEILLPSASVINEINRSRTFTRVNALVGDQEKVAVRSAPESPSEFTESPAPTSGAETSVPVETPTVMSDEGNGAVPEATTPEEFAPVTDTVTEESGFPWFWLAIGVIVVAGAIGFVWYRRKQSEESNIEIETVSPRSHAEDFPLDRRPFGSPERQAEAPFGKESLTV